MNFLIHTNRASTSKGSKQISNEDEGGWGSEVVTFSKYELLRLFPRVRRVAEVTISRSLAVNRLLKVKLLDDDTGPKIPILPDNLDELQIRLLACAISVDKDRQRLGDTDGVRQLDERTASEASGNQGLGWRKEECQNAIPFLIRKKTHQSTVQCRRLSDLLWKSPFLRTHLRRAHPNHRTCRR